MARHNLMSDDDDWTNYRDDVVAVSRRYRAAGLDRNRQLLGERRLHENI